MRFLIAPEFYQEMVQRRDHTPDCYVRPGEYLHHLYVDAVKYAAAQAVRQCLEDAQARGDFEAVQHLQLHQAHYDQLANQVLREGGNLDELPMLGDPPPADDPAPRLKGGYAPIPPKTVEEAGLPTSFLFDMVLRAIYNRGRLTGGELAADLRMNYSVLAPLLPMMRKQTLIDIVGQKGQGGDATFEYEIKPPKGSAALQDALDKTTYTGPCPVPFDDYVES